MELSQKMDNDKQHIDTEFIDQSWNNMSELLDKEMPVQKRKRRFIWLWFLGLATLLSIGVYYGTRLNAIPFKNQKLEVKTEVPVAQTNKKAVENKIENQLAIQKDKKQSISKNSTEKPTINNAQNKNKSLKKVKQNIKKIASITHSVPSSSIDEIVDENRDFIIDSSIKIASATNPQLKASNDRFSLLNNFPLLPLIPFKGLYKERPIEITPFDNSTNTEGPISKWRFGLYAGTLTGELGSYRLGVHSNFELNPKWTVHFGIGYASRSRIKLFGKDENLAPIATFDSSSADIPEDDEENMPASPIENPGSGSLGSGDLEEGSNFSQSFKYTKFQYFEIPILFQYRFHPKWTVDLGGQIAYLHGARYDEAGESFYISNFNALNNTNTRSADTNAGIINKVNFGAVGGFSYNISPKFSAYSNYHISTYYLKSTSPNLTPNKRWQQLEVGVRYYFK